MPYRLTKQVFLNAVACPRLGWFSRLETPPHELDPDQGSLAGRFLLQEARDVHERAQCLFPGAVTVTRQAYEAACWQTQDYLEAPYTHAVLEPAFGTEFCRARPDAVVRQGDGWRICEIRSSVDRTPRLVDELAYSWMVAEQAGVRVEGTSLILLSRDYRPGMPDTALFATTDVTADAAGHAAAFRQRVAELDEATRGKEPPPPVLTAKCRRCLLFRTCAGKGIEHPLFELPHLTPARLRHLAGQGHRAVQDVPDSEALTPRQELVRRTVRSGKTAFPGDLRGHLHAIVWPARYLDIQTAGTAIPLYADLAPFEHFPFLYSVRTCDQPGRMRSHRAFLSPHNRDASHDLAERLLQDLGEDGSIVVYSRHAARVIRWLAARNPDLAAPLLALSPRAVDLEGIVRRDIYHPAFRGSTALRTVVTALASEFNYLDLDIEDETSSGATFAYLARGGYYSEERSPLVRRDLAAYGARNSLALVRIHEALHDLAEA